MISMLFELLVVLGFIGLIYGVMRSLLTDRPEDRPSRGRGPR